MLQNARNENQAHTSDTVARLERDHPQGEDAQLMATRERPDWLKRGGLSYHDKPERWLRAKNGKRRLKSVARGQEFVADIGRRSAPREWLDAVIAEINRS